MDKYGIFHSHCYYIGVDVGKSKISSGVVDIDDIKVVETVFDELPTRNVNTILNIMENQLRHLTRNYRISGIGIACFGTIDSNHKMVIDSKVVKGWKSLNIADYFSSIFNVKDVYVFNDVTAACYGEFCKSNVKNLCFLSVGSSIGQASIIEGKMLFGSHNISGQIAHMPCFGPFDEVGTISQICGGDGISFQYRKLTTESLNTRDIINRWYGQNDEISDNVCNNAIRWLAYLSTFLFLSFDPDEIVLGGGVMSNKYFYQQVEKDFYRIMKKSIFSDDKLFVMRRSSMIYTNAIIGGALLCKKMSKS